MPFPLCLRDRDLNRIDAAALACADPESLSRAREQHPVGADMLQDAPRETQILSILARDRLLGDGTPFRLSGSRRKRRLQEEAGAEEASAQLRPGIVDRLLRAAEQDPVLFLPEERERFVRITRRHDHFEERLVEQRGRLGVETGQ